MASRNSGMPPTGVYLVKLALMARLAASLTCGGVGKSGSPAPKDTTLIPARCNSLALASTAMVAEGAMRRARSASFTGSDSLLNERWAGAERTDNHPAHGSGWHFGTIVPCLRYPLLTTDAPVGCATACGLSPMAGHGDVKSRAGVPQPA